MKFYKTSLNFSLETRPKITKLQSLLQEKEGRDITKGEALEQAIEHYILTLESEK